MQNSIFTTVWLILKYIKYEIIYYLLGAKSVAEDIIQYRRNKCEPIQKSGNVAIITGGARGLGAVVVKKLLQCDMHVIIGCRNTSAGEATIQKIREEGVTSGTVNIQPLDMVSLDSVRKFAETVLAENPKIHLLINNAGIMFPPYTETRDGFESQWGVNYMSHFLLSHLLLQRLNETGLKEDNNTRIINVSSCAHFAAARFNFDNINMKNDYIPSAAYAQSKLAQLMFTKSLDRQLVEEGAKVRVIAVHPGVVDTDIFNGTFVKEFLPWTIKLFFKTPDQGATPILYASISPYLENQGGVYISNCRISGVNNMADEPLLQSQLFQYSNSALEIKHFGRVQTAV